MKRTIEEEGQFYMQEVLGLLIDGKSQKCLLKDWSWVVEELVMESWSK